MKQDWKTKIFNFLYEYKYATTTNILSHFEVLVESVEYTKLDDEDKRKFNKATYLRDCLKQMENEGYLFTHRNSNKVKVYTLTDKGVRKYLSEFENEDEIKRSLTIVNWIQNKLRDSQCILINQKNVYEDGINVEAMISRNEKFIVLIVLLDRKDLENCEVKLKTLKDFEGVEVEIVNISVNVTDDEIPTEHKGIPIKLVKTWEG